MWNTALSCQFSIDILNMYEGLGPEHIEKFVSTLGQTSWYSSYAVLIFPFGAFWYWHDDQRWSRILSAVFIVVGSASLCTVNSDSAYVAYLLIFMVFFWYSMESNEKFGRFLGGGEKGHILLKSEKYKLFLSVRFFDLRLSVDYTVFCGFPHKYSRKERRSWMVGSFTF